MIALPEGLAWGEALRLIGALLGASLFIAMRRDDTSPALRNLTLSYSSLLVSSGLLICAWTLAESIPQWAFASIVAAAAAFAWLRAPHAVAGIRGVAIDRRRSAIVVTGAGLAAFTAVMLPPTGTMDPVSVVAVIDAAALGALAITAIVLLASWNPARASLAALALVATGAALVPVAGALTANASERFWIAAGACRGVLELGLALAIAFNRADGERRRALESVARAEQVAYHDPLTGMPNRALFFDRLNVALAHAERHRHKLAVLFLDLDRFKNVNDSLGHTLGDELIREASLRLHRCMRSEDTVARFGGDEFLVLLRIVGRVDDAGRVAEKILSAISQPYHLGQSEIITTASVGIAIYPADGTDAETLVRNADAAMYRAKESGRDASRFYAPAMNANALEELELESDLRRALEREQLALHYQPLIDLERGRIYGLEALIRWEHPKLGLLAPDRFIPVAESTGLIIPIGALGHSRGMPPDQGVASPARQRARRFGQSLPTSVRATGPPRSGTCGVRRCRPRAGLSRARDHGVARDGRRGEVDPHPQRAQDPRRSTRD